MIIIPWKSLFFLYIMLSFPFIADLHFYSPSPSYMLSIVCFMSTRPWQRCHSVYAFFIFHAVVCSPGLKQPRPPGPLQLVHTSRSEHVCCPRLLYHMHWIQPSHTGLPLGQLICDPVSWILSPFFFICC